MSLAPAVLVAPPAEPVVVPVALSGCSVLGLFGAAVDSVVDERSMDMLCVGNVDGQPEDGEDGEEVEDDEDGEDEDYEEDEDEEDEER